MFRKPSTALWPRKILIRRMIHLTFPTSHQIFIKDCAKIVKFRVQIIFFQKKERNPIQSRFFRVIISRHPLISWRAFLEDGGDFFSWQENWQCAKKIILGHKKIIWTSRRLLLISLFETIFSKVKGFLNLDLGFKIRLSE